MESSFIEGEDRVNLSKEGAERVLRGDVLSQDYTSLTGEECHIARNTEGGDHARERLLLDAMTKNSGQQYSPII